MGKGKEKQQEGTLAQIFDFIFKEAEKPPEKRKPIKATGLSGNKELVDALAAALEKPGVFVSDQILDVFNDALDVKFGSFKTNENGTAKLDFKLSTLKDIIDDPNMAFDDSIAKAKAIRNSMKAQYMGKAMQEFLAMAWAHKNNLDLDVRKAIEGRFKALNAEKTLTKGERVKEYMQARAFGKAASGKGKLRVEGGKPYRSFDLLPDSEKGPIYSRQADLIGRRIFGDNTWKNLSAEKQEDFYKKLTTNKNSIDIQYISGLIPWHPTPGSVLNRVDSVYTESGGKFDNRDFYLKLEGDNVSHKIEALDYYLRQNRNRLTSNEIRNINIAKDRLYKAETIVRGQVLTNDSIRETRTVIREHINKYKDLLNRATNSNDKRMFRNEIRDAKGDLRTLNIMLGFGLIGQMDGYISSWNSQIGGGNALSSILKGDFFDRNRNSFSPSIGQKYNGVLGAYKMRVKNLETGKYEIKDMKDEVKIFLAEERDNKILNRYNRVTTSLYYLTPKSILKTLFFNGEGFLYLSTISGGKAKWAEKFGKFFSFNSRIKDRITKQFDEKFVKGVRQRIAKMFFGRFSNEAASTVAKWVSGGGFQVLGKAIAQAIFQTLGITISGGLANLAFAIVGDKATEAVLKIGKVVIITLMYFLIGAIGLIFILGGKAVGQFNSNNYSYTNEVPGEVLACGSFRGIEEYEDEEWEGEIEPFEAGTLPVGETCLLGEGNYSCTQGVYGGFSHKNTAAVDLVSPNYFHAPVFCGDGNCRVVGARGITCGEGKYAGGMVIFTAKYQGTTYTFKLIHVTYSHLSIGQELESGQRVARIMTAEETTHACSTGMHLHLETKVNGNIVNPMEVLKSPASSGGFGCNISDCN